jgi:hypothetical protein
MARVRKLWRWYIPLVFDTEDRCRIFLGILVTSI